MSAPQLQLPVTDSEIAAAIHEYARLQEVYKNVGEQYTEARKRLVEMLHRCDVHGFSL